MTTAWIGRSD
ncbi:hypothetical protein E2C01_086459 [Portunus trituberculatus]|uniref:Uncharacterized protein n=1 Tax=Portunus trituberculatus TaxID=210409 RepID=A0A5B7JAD1_PORTR|nr:hypothetical protein [Portunus trituberculatus]